MTEWVKYADRKPPGANIYLVADRTAGAPYIAWYTKREGFVDGDEDTLDPWITHWMELPPMPRNADGD
jgi:hypothetical protein